MSKLNLMLIISIILMVILINITIAIENSEYYASDKFIEQLNKMNSTWMAGRNFDEKAMVKRLNTTIGALEEYDEKYQPKIKRIKRRIGGYLPEFFDARQKWPGCRTIGLIHNQGQYCSSCWAVGVVQAINDRICIGSKQRVNVEVSAHDMITCCKECTKNGEGCQGGYPSRGWRYWVTNGLVTGGQHGDTSTCKPMVIPPMTPASFIPELFSPHIIPTPACERRCVNGKDYFKDKFYGLQYYKVPNDEQAIRNEIYYNGPVEAHFRVFPDFHHYKTGVYRHLLGENSVGHSIKIIGWGTENGTPYWLCVNSWTPMWGGMGGFFKILRGQNHCGIESQVYGGFARI